MKKDELIEKMQINKDEKSKLTIQVEKVSKEEKKLLDLLNKSISFPALTITKIIGYLLTTYENKLYIPINEKYYIHGKGYDYLVLVPIDEFINTPNNFSGYKYKYNNMVVIVDEESHLVPNKDKWITFKHLIDEYGAQELNQRVCIDSFDNYPYIKTFISKLASKQIEYNGVWLPENAMLIAISEFINSEKTKPKTKELNKN